MTEAEHLVVDAMEKEGGGFVAALAPCFRKAGRGNFLKLRAMFSDYWDEYEKVAEDRAARSASRMIRGTTTVGARVSVRFPNGVPTPFDGERNSQ